MKKSILLLGVVCLIVCSAGSAKAQESAPSNEIKLRVGQQIRVGELMLQFLSVTQDSRCPENTNCVWAGNASIKLKIKKGKRPSDVVVLNTTTEPTSIVYGARKIRLEDLLPHPREGANPQHNSHIVVLSIEPTSASDTPPTTPPGAPVPY